VGTLTFLPWKKAKDKLSPRRGDETKCQGKKESNICNKDKTATPP
jgi:hypothetical protein